MSGYIRALALRIFENLNFHIVSVRCTNTITPVYVYQELGAKIRCLAIEMKPPNGFEAGSFPISRSKTHSRPEQRQRRGSGRPRRWSGAGQAPRRYGTERSAVCGGRPAHILWLTRVRDALVKGGLEVTKTATARAALEVRACVCVCAFVCVYMCERACVCMCVHACGVLASV